MDTVVKATLKNLRMTPRKVGLVADLVRGRSVDDALVILQHTDKFAAEPLKKLVLSAKANAINNHNLSASGLVVDSLDVGPGDRLKRFRAGARGRAKPYILRNSNITVRLVGSARPAPKKKTEDKTDKKTTKATKGDK